MSGCVRLMTAWDTIDGRILAETMALLCQVRQMLLDTGRAQYAGTGTRSMAPLECFATCVGAGIAWDVVPVAAWAAVAARPGWVFTTGMLVWSS